MLDLSKFSKKWIPSKKMYLLKIEEADMTIYALISKDCKHKKVVKVIPKANLSIYTQKTHWFVYVYTYFCKLLEEYTVRKSKTRKSDKRLNYESLTKTKKANKEAKLKAKEERNDKYQEWFNLPQSEWSEARKKRNNIEDVIESKID